MDFLKEPLYNAIFSGFIIYILITISNRGNPVLGAILSSLPIGLMGLLAIQKKENIQKFYIRSELFTNITIIIMWIVINFLIHAFEDTNTIVFIGFIVWLLLSIIYYVISSKLYSYLV